MERDAYATEAVVIERPAAVAAAARSGHDSECPRSTVLMKGDAENQAGAFANPIHTMLDRLKTIDSANANGSVPSAEQQGVAQSGGDHVPARFLPLGHVAE